MTDRDTELAARLAGSVGAFDKAEWNALAGDNPFVSYEFLTALEDSGSVGAGTGWQSAPIVVSAEGGPLLAAMPAYLKSHSQGEYVFDHSWADAYERAGGSYYPKLQIAAPFTPATGPRLLLADDALAAPLLSAAEQLCLQNGFSSAHATFIEPDQHAFFEDAGWMLRSDIQFHWHNRGFNDFDDFLASLASRKRKDLRKERAAAQDEVEIVRLQGEEIAPEHWDAFWYFYQDTGARKWGRPYLTREAFDLFSERMGDRLLLVLALQEGQPVAGALNFIGVMRSTAATGAARAISASCISSCAITRRSMRRSSWASREWRPAHRAVTSWRGATNRSRRSPPTGSPIRDFARRSPNSSSGNGRVSRRTAIISRTGRLSGKAERQATLR